MAQKKVLTDKQCKNTLPGEKPRKISDSLGLYLEVMPNGSKYWRMKYRFQGKEKRLALGVYAIINHYYSPSLNMISSLQTDQ